MKKIIIGVWSFFLLVSFVAADGIQIDYKKENNQYILEYKAGDTIISFEEAKEQYNIGDYFSLHIGEIEHYFYQGNEIDKETYEIGKEKEDADNRCTDLKESCIRVTSTEEVKNAMDEIMGNDQVLQYHLVYSKEEYKNIDFDEVMDYFEEKYSTSKEKNMYTYEEYGKIHPIRELPIYNEEELIINALVKKITKEEELEVEPFMDIFLSLLQDKSDYEKIVNVYTYISNKTQYMDTGDEENFLKGYLSIYDVFIEGKSVCIGNATAFQYVMEKLGIKSYIVDQIERQYTDAYVSSHTYNVVELDGNWYIVDIMEKSLDGLLIGFNEENYNKEDLLYYDITVSTEDYFTLHQEVKKEFSFDYEALEEALKEKDETTTKNTEEKKKNGIELQYFLLSGILLILFVIIYLFTRKK